jgi:general secretion pathway protein A
MYHEYFGLKEPAFSIAVNPKFLYMSQQHKEALAHLLYGVQEGGFVLLSGEVGTGKTTIIRCLLDQTPENTDIAYILNPMADIPNLLATICDELKITVADDSSIKTLMESLQSHLLESHAKGIRTVLLIDEAQLLSVEVLEQIRLLTNLETTTQKLLQIVLVGQPEINELLAQPRLRQLSQRITARFHLTSLSPSETAHYIEHRLKIAGKTHNRTIFPTAIIKRIHAFSRGTPRLINIICERALVGAYGRNKDQIDKEIYTLALEEVQDAGASQSKQSKPALIIAIPALVCILLVLIALWYVPKFESNLATASNTINKQQDAEKFVTETPPDYLLPQNTAFDLLFTYQDIELSSETHPCWQSETQQYSCDKQRLDTWDQFLELNRPGILSIVTEDKSLAYAVIIGYDSNSLLALNRDHQKVSINKQHILKNWNGQVGFLWLKPQGYTGPVSKGSESILITYIANKFALLDGRDKALTESKFNSLLETRIKLFQEQHKLKADGILGQQTLMKLNEALGLSTPLLNLSSEPSNGN